MRAVIAETMLKSHTTIPPVTLNAAADVSRLLDLRKELNTPADTGTVRKISINDLVLKATAIALKAHPALNATLEDNVVTYHDEINLGMAVALKSGLIVPVVRNLLTDTIGVVAEKTADLAERARQHTLSLLELEGATFSVTNLGMYGILSFNPIIHPPQTAILGVCAISGTPATMGLSLTIDHRVLDGAQGALFLQTLIGLLENPTRILR
jgi:pyruvate dehydrogenase E2 component (dihydrolipoamide acetyltransferase)